jgi:tRNA 2-selenouridine synthase
MKEISYFESLAMPDSVYIDVRSPEEHNTDHIPGSINIPLFDNEERKEVGTIYRMAGREDAIVRGTQIVGEKLKNLVASFLRYQDRGIIILCARGGMRSGSLVSLLDSLGMNVYKLKDGYKGYRHYAIEQLEPLSVPAPLFVLHGLTGAGKTEILRNVPTAIDLEDMAGHRSSVFGGIDMVQKSQKLFETLLLDRTRSLGGARYCLIEGESRKIGNIHIPHSLYEIMKASPAIYIDTPIERRVEIIHEEYHTHCNDENIPAIVKSLTSKLGQKNVGRLISLYAEGSIREFIRIMLEKYYDPLYRYSIERKDYIAIIQNFNTDQAIKEIQETIERHLSRQ